MIVNDPSMYSGKWQLLDKPRDDMFSQSFDNKTSGKIRLYLFRNSDKGFFDDVLPEPSSDSKDMRTLDHLSGRAIYYNGEHRDVEIDINFQIDPLADSLQRVIPIPDPQDPLRLQGIKITDIFSSVALKQNLYLEKETMSRVNLTFTRTNSS